MLLQLLFISLFAAGSTAVSAGEFTPAQNQAEADSIFILVSVTRTTFQSDQI